MDLIVQDEFNIPETLRKLPRYVLLHNAICRSANSLSAPAHKLTFMAMALIPPDLSCLTAAFSFSDFCKAMQMPKGGETFRIFKDAVNECMKCVIKIETGKNEKGKTSWKNFHWFIESNYNVETGLATMEFSPQLAAYLLATKWMYAKLNLSDIGAFDSRYAISIFKMAVSYMSLKGKNENQYNRWYFERTIEELRLILNVPEDAYKTMKDFRRNVIDAPVKIINEAGKGIEISAEGIKKGRRIEGIRFNCQKTTRKLPAKGKTKAATAPEQPEQQDSPLPELDLDRLLAKYPESIVRHYEDKLADPSP